MLQARTNSSRLPAKVLLPVAGYPLAVLSAKRVSDDEIDVIVATSNEYTDDILASTLESYGLSVFRGSLNNTLKRFIDALAAYDDDTIVIRLTCDNVFPDTALLKKMRGVFLEEKLNYLMCSPEKSLLPYGVSVEIMYLHDLRDAYEQVSDVFDQEHVTPFIRRKFGDKPYLLDSYLDAGHLSCTVDTLEEYLRVASLFKDIESPDTVNYLALIERLRG